MALIVAVLGGYGRIDKALLAPVDTLPELVDAALAREGLDRLEHRVHTGHVGLGSSHVDAAFDFVRDERNNDDENVLLLAGKGPGARALANLLFRFESYNVPIAYDRLAFVSLDATWRDRAPDDRLRLPRGWVDVAVNLRRRGGSGGARFDPRDFRPGAFVNEQSVVADTPELEEDERRHHAAFERSHRELIATVLGDALARIGA